MKNLKLKRLFLITIALLLIVICAAEAKNTKASNIANLFTRVNPSLSAKKAQEYANFVIQASDKHKQDPYAIAALIVHESTVNNKAVSKGGDYGLMQVRWKVHEKAIKKEFPSVKKASDLFDARINILFGTEILKDCMNKAGGDLRGGILRYSGGNEKLVGKVTATMKELQSKDGSTTVKKKIKTKKKK
ncbi:MAG: transglycosylase SLT domain-containing protein [Synergistaceae bacterium]|nr:transglycosylase SLT domain-containing protein [Synergistaceae bacterium]